MSVEISFVSTDATSTVAKLAGIAAKGSILEPCPLHVGDVISFPEAPGLMFRVTTRMFQPGGARKRAQWLLLIEPTPDPLDALEAKS